jgi:hypothetical protein
MQERALQEDVKLAPAVEEVAEKEQPVKERYVGGEAPAIAAEGGEQGKTASQLAYDGDSNETELSSKVGALIEAQFGGDLKKAFAHYGDRQSHEPSMDIEELTELLHDADVGNGMNRPEWAAALVHKLDKNADGKITWKEFDGLVKVSKSRSSAEPAAPKPAVV